VLLDEAEALRYGPGSASSSDLRPSAKIYQFPGRRPAPVTDRWVGLADSLRRARYNDASWQDLAMGTEPVLAQLAGALPSHPTAEGELRASLAALQSAVNRALNPSAPGYALRAAAAECERLRTALLRLLTE
jgi:hypothetical protein